MCAPSLAEWLILQTNSGDISSARKARRTVIKDEHRAKAAQRHEVYQERTNKQNDQLKTIKVMKRRNIYIASTLVLALVLMVGFPTSARPQIHVKVKTPNLYVNIIPSITKIQQMVERVEKGIKIPNFAVPQPNMNSVALRTTAGSSLSEARQDCKARQSLPTPQGRAGSRPQSCQSSQGEEAQKND